MLYRVFCPELGIEFSDSKIVEAYGAAKAAEEWARIEDCHSADYIFANGCEYKVHVLLPDGKSVMVFTIEAEQVVEYDATNVERYTLGEAHDGNE